MRHWRALVHRRAGEILYGNFPEQTEKQGEQCLTDIVKMIEQDPGWKNVARVVIERADLSPNKKNKPEKPHADDEGSGGESKGDE
jgi:hypothetical protein